MEIEKTLAISAPPQQVWNLLLDPQVMAGAVPGMKSIDVVSPTEYVAVMHQKIAFISARFKLHTRIVEQKAPEYMRVEGTGEDASVASSLKQTSEVFLSPGADGGTELRIKVHVDLLGRLGAFGLSVMKTKADRLWEEFGANLQARLESGEAMPALSVLKPATTRMDGAADIPPPQPCPEAEQPQAAAPARDHAPAPAPAPTVTVDAAMPISQGRGWWARLLGHGGTASAGGGQGRCIRIEIRQPDKTVSVEWPLEAADQCRDWLREALQR